MQKNVLLISALTMAGILFTTTTNSFSEPTEEQEKELSHLLKQNSAWFSETVKFVKFCEADNIYEFYEVYDRCLSFMRDYNTAMAGLAKEYTEIDPRIQNSIS